MRPALILAEAEDGKVAMCLDTINGWSERHSHWQVLFGAFVPDEVTSYPHENTGPPRFLAAHTARSILVDRWIRLSDARTPVIAPIWSRT